MSGDTHWNVFPGSAFSCGFCVHIILSNRLLLPVMLHVKVNSRLVVILILILIN